jgi:hypothetical protein
MAGLLFLFLCDANFKLLVVLKASVLIGIPQFTILYPVVLLTGN